MFKGTLPELAGAEPNAVAAPVAPAINNAPNEAPTPRAIPTPQPVDIETDTPDPSYVWRAISDKKPRNGDFWPRPVTDADGLSFFQTKNDALSGSLGKPYAAAYDPDEMLAAGYTLNYNGGQPIPNKPGEYYPNGHVSVRRADPKEWDDWLSRTDKRHAEWFTKK